jgi:riboflavin synthase
LFSGIIEVTSPIVRVQDGHGQQILSIRKPTGWKLGLGESVSVDGVCSTVQKADQRVFQVCYMPETLRLTTLIDVRRMARVNLERSLTLHGLIGGHLVQGHVDTTARIGSVKNEGDAKLYEFKIPRRFSRYIAGKGSIAVDGISLTVVKSLPGRFTVSLLDYTLERTTLGRKQPGDRVNIEVDILAKYVEKLLRA